MQYRLIVTDRVEELLDNILHYLVYMLKNPQAAENLLSEIEHIYDNLVDRPEMYAYSEDSFLAAKSYRKVPIPHYDYVIIYRVDTDMVYILGIFHDLESYQNKL